MAETGVQYSPVVDPNTAATRNWYGVAAVSPVTVVLGVVGSPPAPEVTAVQVAPESVDRCTL